MSKLLLTLSGQPSNMSASQLFEDQAHFDSWLSHHKDETMLLANAKVDGSLLSFDGGTGTIESKPDDFQN